MINIPLEIINNIFKYLEPTPTSKIIKKYYNLSISLKRNLNLILKNDLRNAFTKAQREYFILDYYDTMKDYRIKKNNKLWKIIRETIEHYEKQNKLDEFKDILDEQYIYELNYSYNRHKYLNFSSLIQS